MKPNAFSGFEALNTDLTNRCWYQKSGLC